MIHLLSGGRPYAMPMKDSKVQGSKINKRNSTGNKKIFKEFFIMYGRDIMYVCPYTPRISEF